MQQQLSGFHLSAWARDGGESFDAIQIAADFLFGHQPGRVFTDADRQKIYALAAWLRLRNVTKH